MSSSLFFSSSFLNDLLDFLSLLFLNHIIQLYIFILSILLHLLNQFLLYLSIQKLFYLLQLFRLLSNNKDLWLFFSVKQINFSYFCPRIPYIFFLWFIFVICHLFIHLFFSVIKYLSNILSFSISKLKFNYLLICPHPFVRNLNHSFRPFSLNLAHLFLYWWSFYLFFRVVLF